MDFFWLGLGLAAFGYFIADGLRNFKQGPTSYNVLDFSDDEDHKLLKEKDLHWFIGISKEDAKKLIEEYPDVPHITLNDEVYYPKKKLKAWLLAINGSDHK